MHTHRTPASTGARRALVALGLALAAACGDDAGTGPGDPSLSYDLVFDGGGSDGQPRIYRARGDGSAPAVLGAGFVGRHPSPRPDGRALVLQSVPDDPNAESMLAIVEAAGGDARYIEDGVVGGEIELTWSPDGQRVAFTSQRDDAAGDVFVAVVAGRRLVDVRNLTPRQHPTSIVPEPDRTPAWSPDGQWIAFTTYRDGGPAIWVMRPDGSDARAVTSSGNHADFFPTWSPDGREIAFQRNSASDARIGIVSVNGGTPRFLAWPAPATAPAWSPDGRAIAFSSIIDHEMDIFLVSPQFAPLGRVTRPGPDRNPAWMARGGF